MINCYSGSGSFIIYWIKLDEIEIGLGSLNINGLKFNILCYKQEKTDQAAVELRLVLECAARLGVRHPLADGQSSRPFDVLVNPLGSSSSPHRFARRTLGRRWSCRRCCAGSWRNVFYIEYSYALWLQLYYMYLLWYTWWYLNIMNEIYGVLPNKRWVFRFIGGPVWLSDCVIMCLVPECTQR